MMRQKKGARPARDVEKEAIELQTKGDMDWRAKTRQQGGIEPRGVSRVEAVNGDVARESRTRDGVEVRYGERFGAEIVFCCGIQGDEVVPEYGHTSWFGGWPF